LFVECRDELRKKLSEEQKIEEMRKIQVQAGLLPKSYGQRIDWMYSAPMTASVGAAAASSTANAATAKQQEEYMLGKEVKLKDGDGAGVFEMV
jgi:hypothetical protein